MIQYPTLFERSCIGNPHVSSIHSSNLSVLIIILAVDSVLQSVYDHADTRACIFSSYNPSICMALNWKQPNYGVFFASVSLVL